MKIPSNKTFFAGAEISYLADLISSGEIKSDGRFTSACVSLLQEQYGIHKVLMTPSATAALEMAAILADIGPGDEVIMPSFTFSSTANAVVRLGALPVFVDIRPDTLNLDEHLVEREINSRTKAIVGVHYAGVACEMDRLSAIARDYGLSVIEDAAQAVNARYRNRALGSIGTFGAYSFHSTKNYTCGEGGALCINDPQMIERAEIIRDKGTNRSQFLRGEVDRYTWVDVGSSFIPSEVASAFLYAQLEMIEWSTKCRSRICRVYDEHLYQLAGEGLIDLPIIPPHCQTNHHLYWFLVRNSCTRTSLLRYLNEQGIGASSHYVPLHNSPMGRRLGCDSRALPVTDDIAARLVRLPLYPELAETQQLQVVKAVTEFLQRDEIGPVKFLEGTVG